MQQEINICNVKDVIFQGMINKMIVNYKYIYDRVFEVKRIFKMKL